ncbi:MAG TPA: UDP-glucose 6-dehydrogenase [Alphaproteobacteria bacterium]|nr:UDP-glucose 6-dehydrogenase [Alphaproteobacteria bacterium]
MNILFLGTGYVGLVSGTCFAELGANVTCVDIDAGKIESLKKGIIPIYEPGLEELVKKNYKNKKLIFSADVSASIKKADVIFIAVGTPSDKSGAADLTYVFEVAESIARNAKNNVLVITKSTVPVGTGEKIKNKIKKLNPKLKFHIASNPEFLREGSAVSDFMKPDRVVIGVESDFAKEILAKLYKPLTKKAPLIVTNLKSAELAKYAANSYLAMRIAFVNELADLCDVSNANIDDVTHIMGLDFRIGKHYLKCGPGFGGSCFPKDTRAFCNISNNFNSPSKIIEAVINSNENHKLKMVEKIVKAAGNKVRGKKIAILGTAFKANTDDIRDSASLVIIEQLAKKGGDLSIYDPEALENTKKYFAKTKGLKFTKSIKEAVNGAVVIVIATEWQEFKNLKNINKNSTIVDLRNIIGSSKNKIVGLGK